MTQTPNTWSDETWRAIERVVADRCHRILGKVGDHAIEDAVQACLARILEKRHLYDPQKSTPTTWSHSIAENLCIDLTRRRRPLLVPLTTAIPAPVQYGESEDLFNNLVDNLTEPERQLFKYLLDHPDATAPEIRKAFGLKKHVSVQAVKAALRANCEAMLEK